MSSIDVLTPPIQKYPRTRHIEGSRLQPGDEDLESVPFAALVGRNLDCAVRFFPAGDGERLRARSDVVTGQEQVRNDAHHAGEYGFGIAVVNGCCRIPKGLVARPVVELPAVRFFAFTRARSGGPVAELVRLLVANGEAWRNRTTR